MITLSPWFTLGFALGVGRPVGLDKCMMTGVHHDRVVQSTFTALRTFCAPPGHPPFPQPLATTRLSLSPQFSLFQDVVELESHSL